MTRQEALDQAGSLLDGGLLGQAQQVCEQLLEGNRNDIEALRMIAAIAVQRGELDRAEAYCQRCIRLAPRDARHLCNLAKVRTMSGRPREAIAAYDKALRIAANFALALAGKADAFNLLGEPEKALQVLEPFLKSKTDTPEIGLTLAMLLQQVGRDREAVAVAERHLASPALSAILRVRLGLTQGRSHEELGEFDQAFAAYRRANQARGAIAQFDPQRLVRQVDGLISFFTPARLSTLRRASYASSTPVFVAGMARSGTTLVEQIISAHPQGYGAGEVTLLEQLLNAHLRPPDSADLCIERAAELSIADLNDMARAYLHGVSRQAKGALRIVDKYLRNWQHLGLIWMIFPQARVIHCLRDPMDTCLSCYTSALSPMMHAYCADLTHLGLYHRQSERLMKHWQSVLDTPMLDAQYEELVASPEAQTRRIIDFCGLPWDDRCLRAHESKRVVRTISFNQVRRPIYTSSVGRYRPFEAHLAPLRESLNGAD